MPKLSLDLDLEFQTTDLAVTIDHKSTTLRGDDLTSFLADTDKTKWCLYTVLVDPEDEYSGVGIEFPIGSVKKGGIISIEELPAGAGLSVQVKGSLTVSLRAGVTGTINDRTKLKLGGICYLGGAYRGFMSYAKGNDPHDPIETWRDLGDFLIK